MNRTLAVIVAATAIFAALMLPQETCQSPPLDCARDDQIAFLTSIAWRTRRKTAVVSGRSASGPSRHFAAMRNLIATGA